MARATFTALFLRLVRVFHAVHDFTALRDITMFLNHTVDEFHSIPLSREMHWFKMYNEMKIVFIQASRVILKDLNSRAQSNTAPNFFFTSTGSLSATTI